MHTDFQLFGTLFPNAVVEASTLGAWFELIDSSPQLRGSLPRLTSEVGDTWMYGCASDPLKLVSAAPTAAIRLVLAAVHHCFPFPPLCLFGQLLVFAVRA